mmetsp:Transcript_57222/g.90973  ORF Transcript_57222/g.90973 Transcript_57222/m.90973 type:complete len:134 (-) Transcript_57222:151-552(-)
MGIKRRLQGDRILKYGSFPIWAVATGFGMATFLVGFILFISKTGITCCSHDDPKICEDYKSFCERRPDLTDCDQWDSCSSALAFLIIGLVLAVIGAAIASTSLCGLFACLCFEADKPTPVQEVDQEAVNSLTW